MFSRSRPGSFIVSVLTHGAILGWVASGPVREKPKSLYAQTIATHESKQVWYNFHENQKLPEVTPGPSHKRTRAARVDVRHRQRIVANSPKAPRTRQFVWQPAPKVELQADLKSPNLLAIHTPAAAPPPAPKPKPKVFVPPPSAPKHAEETAALAPPPEVRDTRALNAAGNPLGMHAEKAPPRKFVAPRAAAKAERPAQPLPEAPR